MADFLFSYTRATYTSVIYGYVIFLFYFLTVSCTLDGGHLSFRTTHTHIHNIIAFPVKALFDLFSSSTSRILPLVQCRVTESKNHVEGS